MRKNQLNKNNPKLINKIESKKKIANPQTLSNSESGSSINSVKNKSNLDNLK